MHRSLGQSVLLSALCILGALAPGSFASSQAGAGNRFVHLHGIQPYAPSIAMARLSTPQWVGEEGVQAVVILSIDDMNQTGHWENYLRPILERLKAIDGRAPVSIMTTRIDAQDPQLKKWLEEGLSIEVHTIDHPCPLLRFGNLQGARSTVERCVDLMASIPGNSPVAYRMPCCDSMNSVSPRFFSEIFEGISPDGSFLSIDSSVFHVITADDPELPTGIAIDELGQERFRKYLPFDRDFVNTIDDYCYPYVIGRFCWEFPCVVPSDWEAQHLLGVSHPQTVTDLSLAIDAAVMKQGTFTFVFHPHGWIHNGLVVELIDGAVARHRGSVKFLTFREAAERLQENLLLGQSLRHPDGGDRGVRILDLDGDGFMDVVIGNEELQRTRVWSPDENKWRELDLPVPLVERGPDGALRPTGVEFGVVRLRPSAGADSRECAVLLIKSESRQGAWYFAEEWLEAPQLLQGLELESAQLFTSRNGVDRGLRLRDLDEDGSCELLVANPEQSAVLHWSSVEQRWKPLPFSLPAGVLLADADGNDRGLRFVDIDEDGDDDLVVSNETSWSVHELRSLSEGWAAIRAGRSGESGALPVIARDETDNGAWFHSGHLWVQNENTANLPHHVNRQSLRELLQVGEPEPHSTEAALRDFVIHAGFRVELVAAEPLVMDPVAFAFGADAKLWVAEMADYPSGEDPAQEPLGRVRYLEDLDGDGRYDKSTLFLEGIPYPTSVLPWKNGVLVTAAPDIFFAADTDGDGRADVKETLFSGFSPGNPQHRVNGLRLGLDHWVHCANGDSGGRVRSHLSGEITSISGRDFRIRPDHGLLDVSSGMTQFGTSRDDWGHWFGGNNSHPFWHIVLPDHYLRRNPDLVPPDPRHEISNAPGNSMIHPVSTVAARFNTPSQAGHFTSACSPDVYRDDLLGRALTGNMFVCEPVHNLIHREVRADDGVTFRTRRAPEERHSEFLASRDPWFRPTMVRTGPDGALWIADMQRAVIEHPEWIPDEWEQRLDLRAGHALGRIYRVLPSGRAARPIERLDRLSGAELVQRLASSNGVVRDLVQQLLVERADLSLVAELEEMALHHTRPQARLQALCTLSAMQSLRAEIVVASLRDEHPGVQRIALRLAEPLLDAHPAVGLALAELTQAEDPKVRLQLAFTLGEWKDPRAGAALAQVAMPRRLATTSDAAATRDNSFLRAAVLSSVGPENLVGMLAANQDPGLLPELVRLAASWDHQEALGVALEQALDASAGEPRERYTLLRELFAALERKGTSLAALRDGAPPKLLAAIDRLPALLVEARAVVKSPEADRIDREMAARVLGRVPAALEEDTQVLGSLLQPLHSGELQRVAVQRLVASKHPRLPAILLAGWSAHGPGLRNLILDGLLRTQDGTRSLLAALEDRRVAPHDVDAVRRQRLLVHEDPAIARRAQSVLAIPVSAARDEVVRTYLAAMSALQGDATRGNPLFQRRCATCHQIEGMGRALGPDLSALSHLGVEALLTAILDPNRAVESKFLTYLAKTRDGQIFQGLLTRESGNTIALLDSAGEETVLLRSDLEGLKSSPLSYMPEGLENDLSTQDMADLLAYLQHHRPARKEFPGNAPTVVVPEGESRDLQLNAFQSEVYGSTLKFVESARSIAHWRSLDDLAKWTVDLERPGRYRAVLHYACAADCAGNVLVLESEKSTLHYKVASTGGWGTYEEVDIGEITLAAGRQQLAVRAAEPLHLYLIDIRAIRLVPIE